MDVLSPSHMSAQYNDDEAPLYDGENVNGVGVPFSWEEKPGVPLIMKSPNALERRRKEEEEEEAKCGLHTQCTYRRREGNRMHENEKNVCVHENECVQNGIQENVCVSPLPKPPMTTTKQIIHRRSSLHSYLHTKPSSLNFMHKSNHFLSDDPFLSAFHACSLAPTNFSIAPPDHHHDQFLNCSPASSLITQFDYHHQPASSLITQLDHPPLNSKSSLNNLNLPHIHHHKLLNHPYPQLSTQLEYGSFRDYQFLPANQSPLNKLNTNADQALDTRNFISIKSPLSKLNEAFDDTLRLNSKPQLRKLNYEADDRMLSTNPQLSELNYEAASEQKLQASYNYKSPVRRKSCNGSGRCEEKELAAGRHEYGCRTPVRKLIMQSEAARTGKAQARYEGHPAFMVASFQRSPKQKKAPTITQKPAQGRSAHQRSSSYGGYGRCLGCASADSHDSIVRL